MSMTIAPWFEREDYDSFKALVPDDPDFPDTFDEWLKLASEQAAKYEARGGFEKVIVNPQEFAVWCRASGLDANSTTLGAFAVSKAYRQK